MGFSYRELNIIASTAKYHWDMMPKESDYNYSILDSKDKMTTSMLSAILKLSEALDTSHLQKITDIKLTKSGDMLFFNITSEKDISLEEWAFNSKANFFQEVFGIKPTI
jgi:exopolyphosphatase/guanosine-5'-triphosphate,3'-diphosphate pyrophosphatase